MSFGKGMRDWKLQRLSALWLAAFIGYMIFFYFSNAPLSFKVWQKLFAHPMMQVATIVTTLALILHAWIGVWTILTDYVHQTTIRLTLEVVIITALVGYFVWALMILWGI